MKLKQIPPNLCKKNGRKREYTAEDQRKVTEKAQRWCEARDILGNLYVK